MADPKAGQAASEQAIVTEVDGIPVSIERDTLANDMDTLELMADVEDGDMLSLVRLMRHVFGEEQYRNVKASLRKEGRTSVTDMTEFMSGVFAAVGESAKN